MVAFDNPQDLYDDARELYRAGNDAAAALTWARCREAARTLGNHAMAFEAGVWEAEARNMHGDYHRALSLLLSLLADVPPDAEPFDKWTAYSIAFDIQLSVRPELKRLQKTVIDLEVLAARQPHPLGDLYHCRGVLELNRGEWEKALGHFSRGWQSHDDDGYIKSDFAQFAVVCCLSLQRRRQAESWYKHLAATDQDEWESSRQMLRDATLLLALEAGNRAAVADCVDAGCGEDRLELRGRLFLRGAQLYQLDDPSDSAHPARKLAAIKRTQDVHERFDNLLALVDYRLACLRFTVGLPSLDDLYYRKRDKLPKRLTVRDPAKFERQLRGFRVSWHLLLCHARRIDALLECDWRARVARSRWKRAVAIAKAAGGAGLRATDEGAPKKAIRNTTEI